MGEESGEDTKGGGGAGLGLGCGWCWRDGGGEWYRVGQWLRWVGDLQAEAFEGRRRHGGVGLWIWFRGRAAMSALVGAGLDGGGLVG